MSRVLKVGLMQMQRQCWESAVMEKLQQSCCFVAALLQFKKKLAQQNTS